MSPTDLQTPPILSLCHISKRYGPVEALSDINLDIQPGEIFALLGPSGCGKSTLLRLISGFESPSSGELLLDGNDMTCLPPDKRPINMVFQSYAVFPHMSVEDNVAYGLKMDKIAAAEISIRVKDALAQVHMSDFAQRRPDQLSGGQRQRVALARALIKRPRLLLLDEPLSALDARLRDAMRLELIRLQETVGITFIIVTHDQNEAMAMADRIAVMERGKIRQIGTPSALYQSPADAFVADFIGQMNRFDVQRISAIKTGYALQTTELGTIEWYEPLPDTLTSNLTVASTCLTVRPEHVRLSHKQPFEGQVAIRGVLGDIAFQGQHSVAEIRLTDERSISAVIENRQAATLPAADERLPVWAYWDIRHMLLLPD